MCIGEAHKKIQAPVKSGDISSKFLLCFSTASRLDASDPRAV